MYTAEITLAEKITVQEDNSQLLSIQFQILKDNERVGIFRLGFPLETTKQEILLEMQKFCDTYAADQDLFEKNKVTDEANAKADATIEVLVGEKITQNESAN